MEKIEFFAGWGLIWLCIAAGVFALNRIYRKTHAKMTAEQKALGKEKANYDMQQW